MAREAEGITRLELVPVEPEVELPPFTAGAHIDLHLRPDLVRSYSLCNSQDERHRYVICVQQEAGGRGGSRYIHENLRPGMAVEIGRPRNHFALDEAAPCSVLIAGGIGITPILSMARRLDALRHDWRLHYCARKVDAAALLPEVRALDRGQGRIHLHFDDAAGRALDLQEVLASAPAGAHFYCCGPKPMLESFRQVTASLPAARVHYEYFSGGPTAAATDGAFEVELARSGQVLTVAAGTTILKVVQAAGLDVSHVCEEGVCGSCETAVLAGIPDHRDFVLTEAQRNANDVMMICCSRSRTGRLVLDL